MKAPQPHRDDSGLDHEPDHGGSSAGAPPWPLVLRAIREAASVTQDGWGARLGVSRRTIQRWERGDFPPDVAVETQIVAFCTERGLFRAYSGGVLQGFTLTPEGLQILLADARLGAHPASPATQNPPIPLRSLVERKQAGSGAPAPGRAGRAPDARSSTRDHDDARLTAGSSSLPVTVASFVGREPQIEAVTGLLLRHRLITLTGPGGAGKSRLATEVATRVQRSFADGARFVALAPIGDAGLVETAVVHALGLRETPGQPLDRTIEIGLSGVDLLLVLDNFEHVLDAAPKVARWLELCPRLTVLTTSRAPLHLHGEQVYPLPPLTLPPLPLPARQLLGVDEVAAAEAGRLFVERAQGIRPSFQLSEANASAVAEICRRLDGLPLAIELAAARVDVLSPSQIAARLDDRLRLLIGGSRDSPARQQTLRATLDWSYALLPADERVLLRRLAVFAGGFTLDAAERVCSGQKAVGSDAGADGDSIAAYCLPPSELLDLLAHLVDGSLVVAETGDELTRYHLLETVREYAHDQLTASGEADVIRRRHATYFQELAEAAAPELIGPDQRAWLDRLESELDNLRIALAWSLNDQHRDAARAETGLHIAGALEWFWLHHDHLTEARGWLDATLARAGPAASAAVRARALLTSLMINNPRAQYAAGRAAGEECCRLLREIGDRRGLGRALTWLGTTAMFQGDLTAARAYHEESVSLLRTADDPWGLGLALSQLGGSTRRLGDLARSRALRAEGTAIIRQTGERWARMQTCITWGNDLLQDQAYDRAAALYREALTPCLELGDIFSVCRCLNGLGGVATGQGDDRRAAHLLGATEGLLGTVSGRLLPPDQVHFDRARAALAARLGADHLEILQAQGRALSLQEALDVAHRAAPKRPDRPDRDELAAPEPAPPQTGPLTSREWDVAMQVARGLTNRQIAAELGISTWTASTHLRKILNKLGLHRRSQVASWVAHQATEPDRPG